MSKVIELKKINKRFGPVHANKDIDLAVESGDIHGIIGENGAGKSTLMSILYGFYQADSGEMLVDGSPVNIASSQEAIALGIGMVHQHFMLVDTFTVLENVLLGAEGKGALSRNLKIARAQLTDLAERYGLIVDPDAIVGNLPVGAQQRVEILKALYRGAKVLILDEPTGVLTPQEADALFEILDQLKSQGVTILLITHKLREIMAITDSVSVIRRGEMVAHRETKNTNPEELAELMVGRTVLLKVDKKPQETGAVRLSVRNLSVTDRRGVARVKDVSFDVAGGEIVGIAGVSGNGQSQLLEALSGITPLTQGQIDIAGQSITPARTLDAGAIRKLSLGHVPEDRHHMGLVLSFAANESAILGYQDEAQYQSGALMNRRAIINDCADKMEAFDVRPQNPHLKCANFSGGNQQKIVLAREMMREPDVLLVGQPTRGVDIGAIEYIHQSIIEMRDAGKAVLLISVELDEIMSLSDRVLVMFDGELMGEVSGKDVDERNLGLMMAGTRVEELRANNTAQQGAG